MCLSGDRNTNYGTDVNFRINGSDGIIWQWIVLIEKNFIIIFAFFFYEYQIKIINTIL